MKKLIIIGLLILGCGCTENVRAKHWGGTGKYPIAPGQKVIGVTWKEANLWVLTRPMRTNEFPETFEFKENSNFGILSGTIIFQESK